MTAYRSRKRFLKHADWTELEKGAFKFERSEAAKEWEGENLDLGHLANYATSSERTSISFRLAHSSSEVFEHGSLFTIHNTCAHPIAFRVDAYYMFEELLDHTFACPPGKKILIHVPPNSRVTLFWRRADAS